MEIRCDDKKNHRNVQERGLDFYDADDFEFATALVKVSERNGEKRMRALGYFRGRLHVLVYLRTDETLRVISFRRANEREVREYEKAKSLPD